MRGIMMGIALLVAVVACSPATAPAPSAFPQPAREYRPAGDGVYADLFLPDRPGRNRAVLVLGGSEGGIQLSDLLAAALARAGFTALAVAYFAEPGLPDSLKDVPVEYFVTAARLLAARPEVDPAKLVVWGSSRGSEAAALLAGYAPELVHGSVLQSPSSVVHVGYPDTTAHAWTWHGAPLPTTPLTDRGDADPPDAQAALLPIGRSTGPVITICGDQDAIWPSCAYASEIEVLAGAGRVTALRYPLAGHSPVSVGLVADAGLKIIPGLGGTDADDIDAGHDAFTHVVAQLRAF